MRSVLVPCSSLRGRLAAWLLLRIMAEFLEQGYDPKQIVVVSNFPANVEEDELMIHFQKEKNGGGDVDEVVVDGSVAFVIFDSPEGLEHF